jgi:hypothetical protein
LFPFAIFRSLLNGEVKSLERVTLSNSFLGITRAFEPTGKEVPSLLIPLLPLKDPDLQDMKFQNIYVTLFFFRLHKNKTSNKVNKYKTENINIKKVANNPHCKYLHFQ